MKNIQTIDYQLVIKSIIYKLYLGSKPLKNKENFSKFEKQ